MHPRNLQERLKDSEPLNETKRGGMRQPCIPCLTNREKKRMIGNVKSLFPSAVAAAALCCLTACGPKATNPEQLRVVHEQNAQLAQEIAKMQALIKQAGEDVPGLPDQIAAKEAEMASAIKELDDLNRRETEMKLRAIELQDRLDAFRTAFRNMQNEATKNR